MSDKVFEHSATARRRGVRYRNDADIADALEVIKSEDEARFFAYLSRLPLDLRAQTVIELPAPFQADLVRQLDPPQLAELVGALETDDATDFVQLARSVDPDKSESLLDRLPEGRQRVMRQLMGYPEGQAGALMQLELFSARVDETISNSLKRLRRQREESVLQGVEEVMVVDDQNRLVRVIPFLELILLPPKLHYGEVLERFEEPHTVLADAPAEEAARAIERYDLAALPVVDKNGVLLGRITHDDAVDLIEQLATGQMYGLGQVGEEELHESALRTGRTRALWLSLNLVSVTLVSYVIGLFERTLDEVVALAVLMPIVANMAGTAAVQTLTVMVRQIALGELTTRNAMKIFGKELSIAGFNGVVFGAAAMAMSYWRFGSVAIGAAMAASMFISLLLAGMLGAAVPALLRKVGVDPAIASSTVVITLMDVIAFFSFLGLATMLL